MGNSIELYIKDGLNLLKDRFKHTNRPSQKVMKNTNFFYLLGFFCILLIGCGDGCSGCMGCTGTTTFDAYDSGIQDRIHKYHNTKNSPSASPSERTGNPQMYIDISDGIKYAYTDKNYDNTNLIEKAFGAISDDSLEVFELNKKGIKKSKLSSGMAVQKFLDPEKYNGRYAPIKDAIEQIVARENDAIIVTDFEAFNTNDDEIFNAPTYKSSFISWLKQGNSIHFFVSNFTEKYKETLVKKKLYFAVFSYGKIDNNSMITKVENRLPNVDRYDMSASNYVLSNNYGGPRKGGIYYDPSVTDPKARNIFVLNQAAYYNGLDDGNAYEIYQFDLDWPGIDKTRNNYEPMGMNAFLDKLHLDLSNEDAISIESVKVKVTDITEDYEYFAQCNEILNQPLPKVITNAEGDPIIDYEAEKKNQFISYYNSNGTIKTEWEYTAKKPKELRSIFSLNKKLFDSNKTSDNTKVELAIQFHEHFSVENFDNPKGFLKVELIMDESKFNSTNNKLRFFKWPSLTEKGKENNSLLQSITATLEDPEVESNEHVLYTYYIKTR
jgi:hypothetical protein